jgi:ATP-binding cassette subfamily B protein
MKNNSLYKLLILFYKLLNYKEKWRFVFLIFGMIIVSILEVLSIGSVVPFISILFNPELLEKSSFFNFIYLKTFHLDKNNIDLNITLFFIVAIILSASSKIILLRSQLKTGSYYAVKFAQNIFKRHLNLSYFEYTQLNSSYLQSNLHKVGEVGTWFITPFLTILSSTFILLFVISFLIFLISSWNVIFILVLFITFHLIINYFYKNKLKIYSGLLDSEYTRMIKISQETNGAFRDIKLSNVKDDFINCYTSSLLLYRKSWLSVNILNQSPKFFIEAMAIILLTTSSLYYKIKGGDIEAGMIIIGALVLATQRMLPILQNIFISLTTIKTYYSSISSIFEILNNYQYKKNSNHYSDSYLSFNSSIVIENLSFRYSIKTENVLSNINLVINKGDRVGIVGSSGSGKSTLVDIIMGLLNPVEGKIYIDNQLLNKENLSSWQKYISNVPQNIFLKDSTILENIAFGIPKDQININNVYLAAKKSMLHDFIDTLPLKYETIVGEYGIRLSGGQRQRIGIARAFYRDAKVIVFDEATSSLDNQTELDIVNSINKVDFELTIIVIAHRITTLANCNKIYDLSNKNLKYYSSYNEFIKDNK